MLPSHMKVELGAGCSHKLTLVTWMDDPVVFRSFVYSHPLVIRNLKITLITFIFVALVLYLLVLSNRKRFGRRIIT